MAKVTVKVPDGNTCGGCDYLHTETMTYGYCREDKHICVLFSTDIKNMTKCIGCKICMQEDN